MNKKFPSALVPILVMSYSTSNWLSKIKKYFFSFYFAVKSGFERTWDLFFLYFGPEFFLSAVPQVQIPPWWQLLLLDLGFSGSHLKEWSIRCHLTSELLDRFRPPFPLRHSMQCSAATCTSLCSWWSTLWPRKQRPRRSASRSDPPSLIHPRFTDQCA